MQAALGCLADPDPARARGRSAPCARPGNDEGAPPDLSQGEDGSIPGDAGASEGNGAAQEGDSSEPVVTQRSLSEVLDRSRANLLQEELAARDHDDEHRRAWYQVDQSSSSIIWAIPTDWNRLQPEQFRAAMQQYFGVKKSCLAGLEGEPIPQKRTRGGARAPIECDAYGTNLCKVILPGDGHRKHHDEVKYALHRVLTQAGLQSTLEVPDHFTQRIRAGERAAATSDIRPLSSKQLRHCVPDGHIEGPACERFPAGINKCQQESRGWRCCSPCSCSWYEYGSRDFAGRFGLDFSMAVVAVPFILYLVRFCSPKPCNQQVVGVKNHTPKGSRRCL